VTDRRSIPLFLIVFIDLIGFGIVIPILLLHAEESFGASNLEATGLLTAYSFGLVIAGPVLGRLSDAFGRRPVLIVSQIGTLMGFLILGFANSLFLLYLGRIIDGLSGGNISTAQAYMNDITTEENRARGFGIISTAFGAGFIVGPALGGLVVNLTSSVPSLAPYSQNAPFFVAAIFSLTSILGTYFILPESLPAESRSPLGKRQQASTPSIGAFDVLKISKVRVILSFTFITFLAFSLFQSSYPLLARRNLFSNDSLEVAQRNIGFFLTWVGVINVTMQSFFVGPLVKRFGERALIVYATFGRIVAFLGIALSRNPLLTAVAMMPLSIGNAVSQPSLQSIISRFATKESRGRVLGIFQSTNSITLIFGPIIAGFLLDLELPAIPPEIITAIPMFVAAILVTFAFLMSFRILRMELPSQEKAVAPAPASVGGEV
jgi:DHA1 family tetracycline resistance protein-like MFS transporter